MSLRFLLVFALMLAAVGVPTRAEDRDKESVVRIYLAAWNASMQAAATPDDIEKTLVFCSEKFVYEHPQVNARVEGKETARRGMRSHLGETRDPHVEIRQTMSTSAVVVVALDSRFEASDQGKWVPVRHNSILVFEMEGNLIRRILEYR